jgi:glutamine amidotransferase
VIAIVDYEIGNLAAIANMLQRVGAACEITADPQKIADADKLVLPGNGAFDACMQGLRATGLIPLLERRVLQDRAPLLGICVGAQMLGQGSAEGLEPGLGWLRMQVQRLEPRPGYRVPHMGWCPVKKSATAGALFDGLDDEARFYFVHSYFLAPETASDVLLTARYGFEFAAAVGNTNIVGLQFHPEKSHRFGKQLLRNFAHGQP